MSFVEDCVSKKKRGKGEDGGGGDDESSDDEGMMRMSGDGVWICLDWGLVLVIKRWMWQRPCATSARKVGR